MEPKLSHYGTEVEPLDLATMRLCGHFLLKSLLTPQKITKSNPKMSPSDMRIIRPPKPPNPQPSHAHVDAHCRWAGRPPKTLPHARLNPHPKPRHPLGLAAGTSHGATETLQTPVFRKGKAERAAGKNTFTR